MSAPEQGVILAVVIPVYNEGDGIRVLARRLADCLQGLDVSWEVVLVDDHSSDDSRDVLREVCAAYPGFRFLRLSRNSGSHIAVLAGLEHSRGDCAVFMAADLQDPPELIPKMLELWRQGNRIIWAVRAGREGISLLDRFMSRSFYWLLNRFGEMAVPPDGSDFAMMDRCVIEALSRSVGTNPSLFGEIAKLGFRQMEIPYVKQARQYGVTKWNLRKKLKLFADTFVAFSYAPMRAMSYLGLASSTLGFVYALFIFISHFFGGQTIVGYASLMVVVLTLGGLQMIMLGVLGEYLWRTLDESRRRPKYFVEETSDPEPLTAVSPMESTRGRRNG
ncbi:MAG: glycosyltransferase family 2 protein [Bryobacteraceae bacterium]